MERRAFLKSVCGVTAALSCLGGYGASRAWGASPAGAPPGGGNKSPNIVCILVDDLGYGDIGCFNPESKIPTPAIDKLGQQGMRFTDAHAPGALCHPSRYGLLTGRYPFRTELPWHRRPCIEEGRMTIASLLQGCGYSTAMVGKWHLGFTNYGTDKPHEGGPVDRGFDRYFGIPASTDIPPYYYIRGRHMVAPPTEHIDGNHTEGWSRIQGAFWRKGKIAPNLKLDEVLPRFTEESIKTIREHQRNEQEKPLMLYVAFPSPHTPWLPTDPHKGIGKAGLYGEFVAMVDDMVGRILNALDQEGMADNTIVIFTSDNGPVWYDRDMKRFGHDSAGGWRGMKGDAWEAGHRMPFIVRWPGRVEAGTSSSQLICFTDLLATLADLHGVDLPSNGGEDSISFLPVLLNRNCKAKSLRQTFIMQAGNEHFAVRKGPWKLITRLGSGGFSKPRKRKPKPGGPKGQLYNLDDDPGETDNLWLKQPEKVRELTALLNHCRTAACRAR